MPFSNGQRLDELRDGSHNQWEEENSLKIGSRQQSELTVASAIAPRCERRELLIPEAGNVQRLVGLFLFAWHQTKEGDCKRNDHAFVVVLTSSA